MTDVTDRVPELGDLLVQAMAWLTEVDDDEILTVADVVARVPELDALYIAVDDFLEDLDSDIADYAVECWSDYLGGDEDHDAAGWIETPHGSYFVPYADDDEAGQ